MGVYITDYVREPDIEKGILGDLLLAEPSAEVKVLLVWHQNINHDYLSQFPGLVGVVRYGVGFDSVDLKEVGRRGIVFCNTPDYGTDEVSDTALAMAMQIVRGINVYDQKCRGYRGSWQENILVNLRRTSEVKIGVIGAGRIGTAFMRKAAAIGFNVSFYDPFKESGYEKAIGVKREQDIDQLLACSDLVSLHIPLNHETRGIVDDRFLSKMKPGASLINTARGELVEDLDMLYDALADGLLHSVALDVLPDEPPRSGKLINSWRNCDELAARIVINPHTAYYSVESFLEMRRKASENAKRIVSGERPFNIIVDTHGNF